MRPGQPHAVASIALTFTGVFPISFTLSHFVLMLRFDDIHWTVPFTVIVMVWVYDAIAYFAGSAIGGHKLSPKVSPNKSWEGLIAGTLATFIAAWVLKITVSRGGSPTASPSPWPPSSAWPPPWATSPNP